MRDDTALGYKDDGRQNWRTVPCREWQGRRLPAGYGVSGRNTLAHRKAWEETYGPIPPLLSICHYCDNPPCHEPLHLWAGTALDNYLDAAQKGHAIAPPSPRGRPLQGGAAKNAARTRCVKGHPFNAENTRIRPNGTRACRQCGREASNRWKQRRRQAT